MPHYFISLFLFYINHFLSFTSYYQVAPCNNGFTITLVLFILGFIFVLLGSIPWCLFCRVRASFLIYISRFLMLTLWLPSLVCKLSILGYIESILWFILLISRHIVMTEIAIVSISFSNLSSLDSLTYNYCYFLNSGSLNRGIVLRLQIGLLLTQERLDNFSILPCRQYSRGSIVC